MTTSKAEPQLLSYDANSLTVRPLAELPSLRVADRARDVRGWEVCGLDGQRLGRVADLLVDIDRLSAETLLVSVAKGDREGGMAVLPLHGLSPDHGSNRLVPGDGMPPIAVRYESTTHYAVWAAIAVVIIALAAWALGFFQ